MKKYIFIALIFSVCVAAVPLLQVLAADPEVGLSQMSQCSGTDCSACNVVHLANGIIKWLIGILFIIFAILVAVAGVKLVVSGGNHHALDEAKGMFLNAIIGFIIILSAWLIVDTIMRTLVGTDDKPGQLAIGGNASGYLFWSQVQCQRIYTPENKGNEELNFEAEEYFTASGMNSYQAYVYNAANSCKQVASASLPDMAMCQSALQSVLRSNAYVIQDCSGAPGTNPPSWSTLPVCGGATSPGGGRILTLRGGGSVEVHSCTPGELATVNFLGGSVQVQKNLIPSLRRIDSAWRSRGGDAFYNVTSIGGYNCRNIAGTGSKSMHAYGLAIDINPAQNPKGSRLVTNMPPEFVRLFTNEGWGWGGAWHSSKDAMHYSKAVNEQGNMVGE